MGTWFTECRTQETLKKRWRELSLKYHPDRGGAHETFVEISAEYEKVKVTLVPVKSVIIDLITLVNIGYYQKAQVYERIMQMENLTDADLEEVASFMKLNFNVIKSLYGIKSAKSNH